MVNNIARAVCFAYVYHTCMTCIFIEQKHQLINYLFFFVRCVLATLQAANGISTRSPYHRRKW